MKRPAGSEHASLTSVSLFILVLFKVWSAFVSLLKFEFELWLCAMQRIPTFFTASSASMLLHELRWT